MDEDDLFLSFYPSDRTFKADKPLDGVVACDGLQTQVKHEQLLATVPHFWMKNNKH